MIIEYRFCSVPQPAPTGHAAGIFRINAGQVCCVRVAGSEARYVPMPSRRSAHVEVQKLDNSAIAKEAVIEFVFGRG